MDAAPGQPAQGSIVWADVADPRGQVKRRPLVIVTASDELILDAPLVCAAITTTFPEPPPRAYVELPWYSRGHPATRLRRRSAVACHWLVPLKPSDIVETKGYVPTRVLIEILERIRELNEADSGHAGNKDE